MKFLLRALLTTLIFTHPYISLAEENVVDKATGLIKETKPIDSEDIQFSGFLGDDYAKMKKGNGERSAYYWIKEDVDFSKYNKFIIDQPMIYLTIDKKDPDKNVGVNPDDLKELADSYREALVDAFKDGYTVVEKPGDGVLRISPAITSVDPSSKANAAAKLLISINVDTGSAVMEIAAEDSVTGERLAAAVDGRKGSRIGMVSGYTKWGHTKAAFKAWATRFKQRMDERHAAK